MRSGGRLKLVAALTVTLLAVNSIGVASAGAAIAPKWSVSIKGVTSWLGAGKSEVFSGQDTEAIRIVAPGLSSAEFQVPIGKCTFGGSDIGSGAGSPGTQFNVALSCTNAKVVSPSGCTVRSPGEVAGKIVFKAMKSTLVWPASSGKAAGALFSAETAGGPLVQLQVEGSLCTIGMKNQVYNLTGEVLAKVLPVNAYSATPTLSFPEPATGEWFTNAEPRLKETVAQLELGGKSATLQTTLSMPVISNNEIGVFEG